MKLEARECIERIEELGSYRGLAWFESEIVKGELTPDEFERRMRLVQEVFGGEPEDTHMMQDELMLEALRQNGYGAGAGVYYESVKWFA